MVTSLLDRQVSLLEYLTSSEAIFTGDSDAARDQALQGINPGLLRLEARFSHEKRMEKITAVFPRAFQLLGAGRTGIVREFVKDYPPVAIGRLENASQFHDFLCARWRHTPPQPPYLRDVAACEFSYAKARIGDQARSLDAARGEHAPRNGVRRHPDVVLLHCDYDIQPIFASGLREIVPVKRDTRLAIVALPDAEHPKVCEVLAVAFDVLTALDDWTDRSDLGSMPELDELIGDLAEHGLVEVRR
jgi:hypothetical protein